MKPRMGPGLEGNPGTREGRSGKGRLLTVRTTESLQDGGEKMGGRRIPVTVKLPPALFFFIGEMGTEQEMDATITKRSVFDFLVRQAKPLTTEQITGSFVRVQELRHQQRTMRVLLSLQVRGKARMEDDGWVWDHKPVKKSKELQAAAVE